MKKIYSLSICCLLFLPLSSYSAQESITIKGKSYSYYEVYRNIDAKLDTKFSGNILEKYEHYKNLKAYLHFQKKKDPDNENFKKLGEIIDFALRSQSYTLNQQVHKILLGYSHEGKEIFAYTKGNPERGYKLVVANIHGGYEYGTYLTANLMIKELKKSESTGWMIIPTANPDGLEEYFQKGTRLNAYLTARDNARGVDLNRNFCTQNFILTEFQKYGHTMLTGIGSCESEKESQILVDVLDSYYITSLISLHSTGNIFYIPDNSIDDTQVINLGTKLRDVLGSYDFYPDTSTQEARNESIEKYEIDEGGKGIFTGTFETYAYEVYGIPSILLELDGHGVIEYNMLRLLQGDI